MRVTIVYQSRTGKTAFYAREIAMYLWQKGVNVSLCCTSDFKKEKLDDCDCLLLGCWTSGWFLFNQHPNAIWVDFAEANLQGELPRSLVLFTTYKFRTGSLFNRMKKRLNLNNVSSIKNLQSRTGFLSEKDKMALNEIVTNIVKH